MQATKIVVGLAAAAVIALSGCSTGTLSDDYSNPANDSQYQQVEQYEIEQDRLAEESEQEGPSWMPGSDDQEWEPLSEGEGWGGESRLRGEPDGGDEFEDRCEYDPTMNYDWHDDYVCDGERLYLLPNDEFVDEQELEQAAREWVS